MEIQSHLSEVRSSDLTQWLESLIAKDVKPIRERASYLVSRSTDALNNIQKTATALSEEVASSTSAAETSKTDVAKNFGIRIGGLVDGVKAPESISYETLTEFLNSLRKFHAELIYAGSIWIRKLDPRYRETIRKMELSLREIRTYGKMLEEHLDRKYLTVRKYETLLRDAETIRTVSRELARIEDEILRVKDEKDSTRSTREQLSEERRKLESSQKLAELSALQSKVDEAQGDIVGLFRPLEKPVEKLLKLSEREKQRLNPTAAANLSDYVTDPAEKLSRSNINYPELESALNGLQSMLERNVIDLKDSRVRAALKSISLIKDRERLEQLREKCLEATSVYQKASQSEEVRSLLLKRDEMDSKRNAAEEMVGRLDRALSAIQARKEELSKRFVQLKDGMERSIKEVTGQSIQISNL